jgi:hypothetical protein
MKPVIVAFLILAALCAAASAQVSMTGIGLGAPSTGGGGGQSVWNPTDKDTSIALATTTVTNDTATQNGAGSSWRMARGTQGYATSTANKKVLAYTITTVDSSGGWIGGVADTSVTLASYVGSTAHALGVQPGGHPDYQDGNGGAGGNTCGATIPASGTLWIAIDFNTGNFWCSADCTTWLGNGTPNPDSGTGAPYTLAAATYFPAWSGFDASVQDVAVINTKPSLGGCSNITTFSQWG